MSNVLEITADRGVTNITDRYTLDRSEALRGMVIAAECVAARRMNRTLDAFGSPDSGLGLRADAQTGAKGSPMQHRGEMSDFHGHVQDVLFDMAGPRISGAMRQLNAQARQMAAQDIGIRVDAFDGGASPNGPITGLTQWMHRLIKEPDPVLNLDRLATFSNTLHPGALEYQAVLIAASGEAKVYGAGLDGDYNVSMGINTYNLCQKWLMNAAPITLMDAAHSDFMGINRKGILAAQMVLGHKLVQNRIGFRGNPVLKLWGLRNHPGITRYFTNVSLASASGDTLEALCSDLIRSVVEDSAQMYTPTVLAAATPIMSMLKTLRIGTAGTSAVSVKMFLEQTHNVTIEEYNEFDDLEASGFHYMFAFPRGAQAAPTFEAAPPYMVPEVNDGLVVRMHCLSRCGGMFLPHTLGVRAAILED